MHFAKAFPALLVSSLLTTSVFAHPSNLHGPGQVLTHEPRESTAEYLIRPNDHYNVYEYEMKLYDVVPQDSVYTAEFCRFGILYWSTKLTSAQAKSLEDPSVEITKLDSNDNQKRDDASFDPFDDVLESAQHPPQNDTADAVQPFFLRRDGIVSQSDASDDMKVIATKKGKSRASAYRYKSSAGQGVTVFVIDSGFQVGASVREFPKASSYQFLYAKFATRGKDDPAGHGTRVASRIVGTKYGLAKNVNLVFVKVDLGLQNAWPSVIDALGKVSDYVLEEGISKGVINMSFKLPVPPNRKIVEDLETELDSLSDDGMVLNTSSGNEGIAIDSHPALLKQKIPAMNVVGAVDNDGKIWSRSNTAKYVNLYVPGVDLRLVGKDGNDNNAGRGHSGTSYSCAGASAIAAYLYREKESAAEVNKALVDFSWSRINGGPDVIYNGVDG
ncbi:hypothetical protein N7492_008590 [Penicillium capsulatum]|uniref:Peptidase S8/S53 domain-containing protein n=1 Tax=Penicillium capsulatum TaxID=69766 RepID=A0A9W9LH89_9EURO|nr:hypothetical protein N7492_008590 [Penicillium capsulatum]KAJ6105995.1 hypothetical protein N7512_009512 [Penicillium capsulatum]